MQEQTSTRLCECGCGEFTPLAKRTNVRYGHVKGQPLRFASNHKPRKAVRYTVEDRGHDTPCWVWAMSTDEHGYGRVRVGPTNMGAHRHYWIQANGPVPAGKQLDHLCRVRRCVNPDHLEPVTLPENVRRGASTPLTAEDAAAIRTSTEKRSVLAARYGVSKVTVRNIQIGRTWA